MTNVHPDNADQAAYWNGPGGQNWIDLQDLQDALLAPVSDRLFAAARPAAGERGIDIGCGCGETTLRLAAQTGPAGRALGLDISEPMVARARERAAQLGLTAQFLVADATAQDLSAEAADLMISRFGVMFFADPALSFANMRRALKPGGRLVFACWREAKQNPWLIVPLRATMKHAPPLPEAPPDAPGPFAFASEARVRDILTRAGFSDMRIEAQDLELDRASGRGFETAVRSALEIGPAARVLHQSDAATRVAAEASIREALAPYAKGDNVWMGASIWIVSATA